MGRGWGRKTFLEQLLRGLLRPSPHGQNERGETATPWDVASQNGWGSRGAVQAMYWSWRSTVCASVTTWNKSMLFKWTPMAFCYGGSHPHLGRQRQHDRTENFQFHFELIGWRASHSISPPDTQYGTTGHGFGSILELRVSQMWQCLHPTKQNGKAYT